MNILIISDNPVFSLGLRSTIAARFPLTIFFEVNSLQLADHIIRQQDFEIMILDAVSTHDSKSVQLVRGIREDFPDLGILVDLGDESLDVHFYIRLGANAFVSSKASAVELQSAVIALASNPQSKYVSSDIEQLLLSQLTSSCETIRLTVKEKLIARLLVSSRSRNEIAQTVGINPNSVSNYKRIIFEKLRVASIPQLKAKMQIDSERV